MPCLSCNPVSTSTPPTTISDQEIDNSVITNSEISGSSVTGLPDAAADGDAVSKSFLEDSPADYRLLADRKVVQRARGTKAANNALTGADGELTVDTTRRSLRLHNGSRAGGLDLRDKTDARAFGAKENDSTFDSTLAIQAALTDSCLTGRQVHLPAGTYYVTDSILPTLISGETTKYTMRLSGDGGTFVWGGAGTRIVVKPSLASFPKAMVSLTSSRQVRIEGIRFVGLGKTDVGSIGVHYKNFNQNARFIECGFEGFESAFQVGTSTELSPGNDDFTKYDKCEVLNCTYGWSVYNIQGYHHKVTRAMVDGVDYVARFFADAGSSSLISFSLKDSFVGDVKEAVFHVEGNPNGVLECLGNLFEVATSVDMPRLYVSNANTAYGGTAIFSRNQFNWGGYGVTTRPFIDVKGLCNVSFVGNKVGVYRPIIYAQSVDATPCLFRSGNEWTNRPVFFLDNTHTAHGHVVDDGTDHHVYGQSKTASNAFPTDNVGDRSVRGLNMNGRRIAYIDSVTEEQLERGSVLFNATPGTADTATMEFLDDVGGFITGSTTCSTTSGSPDITVASNAKMVIGQYIIITGLDAGGLRKIKNINGTAVTLTTNANATLAGAALNLSIGRSRLAMRLSQAAIPTAADNAGSFAIHADAAAGEPSGWAKSASAGWLPWGIAGAVQCAAEADASGWADATAQAKFNALLAKLRTSKLIAT